MDSTPVGGMMTCPRGHLTPAEKTFCDSCGAALHTPPTSDLIPQPRPRRSLRRLLRS